MESAVKTELENRLKKIEQTRFPEGLRSLKFSGKSLAVLESELLGGCYSIIATNGRTATRLRNLLDENLEILAAALLELEGSGAAYFTEIQTVAQHARSFCLTEL